MKRIVLWALLTVVLALGLHWAGMWYFPSYLTSSMVNTIQSRRGLAVNKLYHGELRWAGTDPVPRDNPDTVTSFGVYDVSETPVRIRCVVPESDNYWSLTLFAWNTDNFYVVNDRTAESRQFDLVIVKPGSGYRKSGNEEVITSPTDKGVIIVRLIVTDREDQQQLTSISEVQKLTTLEPIADAAY